MATKLKAALEALKPREPTKQELYEEAQFLGISGRSKMNKGALKAAVKRRRDTTAPPRI
jgi:hypothetical protein